MTPIVTDSAPLLESTVEVDHLGIARPQGRGGCVLGMQGMEGHANQKHMAHIRVRCLWGSSFSSKVNISYIYTSKSSFSRGKGQKGGGAVVASTSIALSLS